MTKSNLYNKQFKSDSARLAFLVWLVQCLRWSNEVSWSRASHLNWALVCKRKNAAISQDLVVKAQSLSCRISFQF